MPEVAAVASPYGPHGAAQISRDGRIAYATVHFTGQADNLVKADVTRVIDTAEAARAPGLDVQLGGQAIESAQQTSVGVISAVGVLAAAVVLSPARQPGRPAKAGSSRAGTSASAGSAAADATRWTPPESRQHQHLRYQAPLRSPHTARPGATRSAGHPAC
jgi:MMPL family